MSTETIMLYFLFAFTGWVIELIFRSVYEKKPVNPGFHKGPWLPVYGLTGLIIVLVAGSFEGQSIVLKMVFYFVLSSGLELAAGIFLEKAFNRRYWDYRENRFNIRGYICPLYSCAWVLICLVVEYFLLGRMIGLIRMIPDTILARIDAMLLIVFTADFLVSSGIWQEKIKKIMSKVISYISDNWKHS